MSTITVRNSGLVWTGRIIQTFVGLTTSIAPYIADYNETHVFNPNWPPHAKFHNGQTMSFGFSLGIITNLFVWKWLFPKVLPSVDVKDASAIAALTGSLYYICGVSGILYPGTRWLDPEFEQNPDKPGGIGPQAPIFVTLAVLAWVGMWATHAGLSRKAKTV